MVVEQAARFKRRGNSASDAHCGVEVSTKSHIQQPPSPQTSVYSSADSTDGSERDDDSVTDISDFELETKDKHRRIQDESPAEVPRASIYDLQTEMLQAIFMELPTLDAAKAVIITCRGMRAAFQGDGKRILRAILSRELGSPLPGTIGALAIFVSPRKGLIDEPLLRNMSISTRYWAKMFKKYEEKVKGMITLTMANQMLASYREFERNLAHSPRGRGTDHPCSACTSLDLSAEEWNPLADRTNDNCTQHLLQANAVRYRLNCRRVLGHATPGESLEDDSVVKWDYDSQPVVGDIMRKVESVSEDEPELEDQVRLDNDIRSEDAFELESESGYEVKTEVEDAIDFYDGIGTGEDFQSNIIAKCECEFEDAGIFDDWNGAYQFKAEREFLRKGVLGFRGDIYHTKYDRRFKDEGTFHELAHFSQGCKVCSENAVYQEDEVGQEEEVHSHDKISPKDENVRKENDHPRGKMQQKDQTRTKGKSRLKEKSIRKSKFSERRRRSDHSSKVTSQSPCWIPRDKRQRLVEITNSTPN